MSEATKVKLAINGFGRIGRISLRAWYQRYLSQATVVAINTSGSMPVENWAHLLKHDSVYGRFPAMIEVIGPRKGSEVGRIIVGGIEIPVLAERDPQRIPWKDYQTEVVLDCTGVFLDRSAEGHFRGGAKKVIISSPPKDETIPVFIFGVNEERFNGENLVSNGSCTTNCVAPIVKLVDKVFGFQECVMTTIHAYTSSQNIVDGSLDDLRRARAAALNIIPTGTGAAQAVIAAYPEAKGRFAASAIRVPVACGSYAEFVFKLKKKVTVDQVNQALEKASLENLLEIVKVSYEPLVSSDIIGNSASAIVELSMTEVLSDDMLKVAAWYDNEYGYSCRLVEMGIFVNQSFSK